jgi:hypothetical protein
MRLGARFACTILAFTGLATFAACGSSGGSGDDDGADDDTSTPDANTTLPPDADNTGFTEIIGRDWDIPPGDEIYRCVRVQVPEDMLVSVFRATAPQGTHHTVLTVSDSGSVGEYDCSAGSLDSEMLFASGVGTDDLAFPDGVAIRVEAGRYLNLNLHLFNTTNGNMTGHSGILVKTIPSVEPDKEAEMVFAGSVLINIDPMSSDDVTGGCTFDQPATILAYWPHMHQYATHQTVTMTVGGQAMTLHDQDYSFDEQKNYPLDTPLQVNQGDSISVTCSYTNNTNGSVTFGDSSTKEMCFTGLYRYPKQANSLFECTTPCSPGGSCPLGVQ